MNTLHWIPPHKVLRNPMQCIHLALREVKKYHVMNIMNCNIHKSRDNMTRSDTLPNADPVFSRYGLCRQYADRIGRIWGPYLVECHVVRYLVYLSIIIGAVYYNDCPDVPFVPNYMIITGIALILTVLLYACQFTIYKNKLKGQLFLCAYKLIYYGFCALQGYGIVHMIIHFDRCESRGFFIYALAICFNCICAIFFMGCVDLCRSKWIKPFKA